MSILANFPRQVIIRLLACTAAGAGEPHRRHPVQPGPIEDHAGGDHPDRVRALRHVLHEPAVQARLRVGGAVPGRRRVFHFPQLTAQGHSGKIFRTALHYAVE